MINYSKNSGDKIVLHAIIINSEGEREQQPSGYPLLDISIIGDSGTESILTASSLTEDVTGEHYYIWTAPETIGSYKARYTVSIENELTYGYDFIDVLDSSDSNFITVVGL